MSENPFLPLFPLRLVAFPGELVPLHIFEERYKAMVAYCRGGEATARPFGIVLVREEGTAEVGCTMTIERVITEYDDGRLDLLALGRTPFAVLEVFRDRPYFTARVGMLEDEGEPPEERLRVRAAALLHRLAELGAADAQIAAGAGDLTSFHLATAARLTLDDRQRLLALRNENRRLETVVELLGAAIARETERAEQRRIAGGNGKPTGRR